MSNVTNINSIVDKNMAKKINEELIKIMEELWNLYGDKSGPVIVETMITMATHCAMDLADDKKQAAAIVTGAVLEGITRSINDPYDDDEDYEDEDGVLH